MAAQIQAFMLACPVSPTASRAVRWDQLKVHIQDVARNYCSTFHADRTRQLRALRMRASQARAAYLADPTSQPALDQLRHTAAHLQQHRQQQAATEALRAGVLLHEYGDQSTYYFHHFFFFFFGYRGDVYSFMARSRQGRQTNLRCAGTTA
ncbi:hypothetical protein ABBQ38_008747 [Trebouxia sp. C0009 RCD-2024]